jgi:hypothetical protein
LALITEQHVKLPTFQPLLSSYPSPPAILRLVPLLALQFQLLLLLISQELLQVKALLFLLHQIVHPTLPRLLLLPRWLTESFFLAQLVLLRPRAHSTKIGHPRRPAQPRQLLVRFRLSALETSVPLLW